MSDTDAAIEDVLKVATNDANVVVLNTIRLGFIDRYIRHYVEKTGSRIGEDIHG